VALFNVTSIVLSNTESKHALKLPQLFATHALAGKFDVAEMP